jgi:hypothetical protein
VPAFIASGEFPVRTPFFWLEVWIHKVRSIEVGAVSVSLKQVM